MRFLAIPGIVSLPLFTVQDLSLNIVYGSYELLDDGFAGFNGNVFLVTRYSPKINARIKWLLGKNYVWVWERGQWLRNGTKVGTLYLGSTADVMVRVLITLLGIRLDVVNYDDFNDLIKDYELGKIDAMVLPLIYIHKVNDAPSYPIDKLYMEYLGQVSLAPYAIAVKDEAYTAVKAAYELGIKNMAKTDIKNVLMEQLRKFDLNMPETTLGFIISNVRFNLISTEQDNNTISLINSIYKDKINKLSNVIVPLFD